MSRRLWACPVLDLAYRLTTAKIMTSPTFPGAVAPEVIDKIQAVTGDRGCLRADVAAADIGPHCVSWRDGWEGWVPLVVKPANTTELADVVRICAESATPIVPQGGNTGLTGGSQPHDSGNEVIISTSRMSAIRDVDLANDTITVEAGCVLEKIQQTAEENNRLFPLSLAAEGSCQIGGNLATNAGGTQVLRYGNARALVLGLEVVLPDGRIWDGLRGLRKDNTGYDLKQWFIGSEGTLGIITAAVLKLYPRPGDVHTAMLALPDAGSAVQMLGLAREYVGEQVTTFELIPRLGIDMVVQHVPGIKDPLDTGYPWYVLMEVSGQGEPGSLTPDVQACLEQAFERGLIVDAAIAANRAQGDALWSIRESLPEAQKHDGASIKHDISVPISRIAEFIETASTAVVSRYPGARPLPFGHVGDGNIHFNISQPTDADGAEFYSHYQKVNEIVHDIVNSMHGSISAEHGIGRLRLEENYKYKSDVEIDLMRSIKKSLDPLNIMNPGKLLRPGEL